MLFAGAQAAAALMAEPDADDHRALPRRPRRALPGGTRAGRGSARPALADGQRLRQAGPAALQAAIEGPLGAHANIHLAGDYFAELGNLEMAARTGAAAAERAASMLDRAVESTTMTTHAEAIR